MQPTLQPPSPPSTRLVLTCPAASRNAPVSRVKVKSRASCQRHEVTRVRVYPHGHRASDGQDRRERAMPAQQENVMTAPPLDSERLLADAIAGKFPDAHGRFGPFGGRFVPETLIPALERLEDGIRKHLH